jgi:hypothetical protein
MAHIHFEAGTETLIAVTIGAVLATVGGFAATQVEGHLRRRERERSAALFYGELFSVLELITRLAADARSRGDPYGPVTMRLLRAAQREVDIYDRNRESLYDLRSAGIRAQIQTVMVRVGLALEGVFDATSEIGPAEKSLAAMTPTDIARPDAERRLAILHRSRELAFEFGMETADQIRPVIVTLRPIAKHAFDAHLALVAAQAPATAILEPTS